MARQPIPYCAFGARVESASPLPWEPAPHGWEPAAGPVRVVEAPLSPLAEAVCLHVFSPPLDSPERPLRLEGSLDAGAHLLAADAVDPLGRARLWVAARQLVCDWPQDATARALLATCLEHVLLPLLWQADHPDGLALHGSAVCVGGQGWAFVGASGAGKSTTAHALLSLVPGARLLSDDLALISCPAAAPRVWPGVGAVRLWDRPDVEAADAFSLLDDGPRHKRWLRLPPPLRARDPAPLRGIVCLRHDPDAPTRGALNLLTGAAAAVALLGQSLTLSDAPAPWAKARFQSACALARRVPVWALTFAPHPRGLPDHLLTLRDTLWPHLPPP